MKKELILMLLCLATSRYVHAQDMLIGAPSPAVATVATALCVCCVTQTSSILSRLCGAAKETPSSAQEAEALPADAGEESCCEKCVTAPCDICSWLLGPKDERTVVYYDSHGVCKQE